MNGNLSELAKRVQQVILLRAEDQIELEWARVLDCGAVGPSRDEPILFHQGAEDWDAPSPSVPGSEEGDENA